MRKFAEVQEKQLLDDLVPGHARFPLEKMTKLIQKDYDYMKFEQHMKDVMLPDMGYDGDENPKRLQELKKAAIEVDRSHLINKQYQKLMMKNIYG